MGLLDRFSRRKKNGDSQPSKSKARSGRASGKAAASLGPDADRILANIKELLSTEGTSTAMNAAQALMLDQQFQLSIEAWSLIAKAVPAEQTRCETQIALCLEKSTKTAEEG